MVYGLKLHSLSQVQQQRLDDQHGGDVQVFLRHGHGVGRVEQRRPGPELGVQRQQDERQHDPGQQARAGHAAGRGGPASSVHGASRSHTNQ